MDAIDRLLAQISNAPGAPAEAQAPPPPPSDLSPPGSAMEAMDDLLAEIAAQSPSTPGPAATVGSGEPSSADLLLNELRAEYKARDAAAAAHQHQQAAAERQRQAQLQAEQRAALATRAETWLAELDPYSNEGLWFEEFSSKYPSRLEAAIDYLQAVYEQPGKAD